MAKKVEKENIQEIGDEIVVDNSLLDENTTLKSDVEIKLARIQELEQELNEWIDKYKNLELEMQNSNDTNTTNLEFIKNLNLQIEELKNTTFTPEIKNEPIPVTNKTPIYSKSDKVYLQKFGNQVFMIVRHIGYTLEGIPMYSAYSMIGDVSVDAYPENLMSNLPI